MYASTPTTTQITYMDLGNKDITYYLRRIYHIEEEKKIREGFR